MKLIYTALKAKFIIDKKRLMTFLLAFQSRQA